MIYDVIYIYIYIYIILLYHIHTDTILHCNVDGAFQGFTPTDRNWESWKVPWTGGGHRGDRGPGPIAQLDRDCVRTWPCIGANPLAVDQRP